MKPKTVEHREIHFDDDIHAASKAGDLDACVADFKAALESDFKDEISRTRPPKKGERLQVREFYADGSQSGWMTVTVK